MHDSHGVVWWLKLQARVFQRYGHTVKLISPQFVKPFVKTNKNDANDAEAMVDAASGPSMHYVPVKQVEQQDIQSMHRVQSRLVKNRTALINEIRGLNLEYGIAMPQGAAKIKNLLIYAIDDKKNELTASSRELMRELYDELVAIETRIKRMEQKIKYICKRNDQFQRLLGIPGIGEIIATALVAAVPNANEFKNGRHMAAWLGLVPRQSSSGNKQVLLGISKQGDRYLRTLLIHGGRSVLSRCKKTESHYGKWLASKRDTLSLNKVAVKNRK